MSVKFYETKGFTSIHEERHLVMLNLLKNKNCRVIFVNSTPLEADIIKYRLQMYANAYGDHDQDLQKRLILLSADDDSNRCLAEKILENEPLMDDIRRNIRNPDKAIMLSYICNPIDEIVRDKLGLRNWFGSPPSNWGSKSGSRQIFQESGVPIAPGIMEPVFSVSALEDAIYSLQRTTGTQRVIVKLDDGSGGYGNVVVDFRGRIKGEEELSMADVKALLKKGAEELLPFDEFTTQTQECGAIIEQMIDPVSASAVQTTPSVQLYISDTNKVQMLSSHEQVVDGVFYMGCRYPAQEAYLDQINQYGKAAGEALSRKGVRGFLGVDFLCTLEPGSMTWSIIALEINLRLCATTFSYFSLLTVVDEKTVGRKHYIQLDEVTLRKHHKVSDLQREVVKHGLSFNWEKGTGILFTTFSGLESDNEVSVMCIGDTPAEVDELQRRFMSEMAYETTGHGHGKTIVIPESVTEKIVSATVRRNEQGEVLA